MTTLDPQSRFTPDDRYELATRAESQMRRNHPSHLVVLAVMALIASLIVLALAWRTDAKAHQNLRNKVFQLGSIKSELETLERLEQQAATTTRNAEFDPIPNMRSRLETIASSVGLDSLQGVLPKTSSNNLSNAIKRNYTYTVRDESLENILAWVQGSVEQVPGLQVSSIDIKPTNTTWTVLVTLYRYERFE
jgi:type II secretory pathway pseudopilin PulG